MSRWFTLSKRNGGYVRDAGVKGSKQYAISVKPRVVKDIISGEFEYAKDLAEKWGISPNTVLLWAHEINLPFEDARTLQLRKKLDEMERAIPYLGKWTDTDVAIRFEFHATRVRTLRESLHIAPVSRSVFMSTPYREARLEFIAERETQDSIGSMLQSWGRSKRLKDYVEELRDEKDS
jgi:hypothetical protein